MLKRRNKRSSRGSNIREFTQNEDVLPILGTWMPGSKKLNAKKTKPSSMPKRCNNVEKRQNKQGESTF